LQESRSNAGIYRNLCKIPDHKAKNRNFLSPAKSQKEVPVKIFLRKKRIYKNPEEYWTGTKNRDLEMDIPETGIGNLDLMLRDFDHFTMDGAGFYHGVWWTDTLDPAYSRKHHGQCGHVLGQTCPSTTAGANSF